MIYNPAKPALPRFLCLLAALLLLISCNLFAGTEQPPTVTPEAPTPTLPRAVTPTSPAADQPAQPEEAILILEPGPGSRLTSPLRVRGMADSTFEQHLVVRVVSVDGGEIAFTPALIQSELGTRGPFEIDIPFSVAGETQAFIQVYAASPRDGGITHLSSVGVLLAESGPQDIRTVSPYPERFQIFQPAVTDTISGGVAHVEGFALASFEQTLVVDILDESVEIVGSQAVIVTAPDLGIPGPFSADVPYTVTASGPGRVVVRDPSVAFEGDAHLASVEVVLSP